MSVNSGNWWTPQPQREPNRGEKFRQLLGLQTPSLSLRQRGVIPENGELGEFKMVVKASHDEGIEVILDVAYNHTAEGNERGPT
jgi:hypothetical protein